MLKVKILKDCKGYKQDKVVRVSNAEAQSLINCGCAELYKVEVSYEDKMMRSKNKS